MILATKLRGPSSREQYFTECARPLAMLFIALLRLNGGNLSRASGGLRGARWRVLFG